MSTHAPYRLETEALVLRGFEFEDVEALTRCVRANQADLARWMPWAVGEVTLDGQLEFVRRTRASFDAGEDFGYGVFDRDGALVGAAGLIRRPPEGYELGYWIGEEHRGRGHASEAAGVLIRTAFTHLGARRVEIRVDPDNAASLRVADKLGLEREGLLRRRLEHDGRWVDLVSFSLLADEFPSSRAARYGASAFDPIGRAVALEEPA